MILNKRLIVVAAVCVAAFSSALADFDGPAPLAWRWQQPTSQPPTGMPVVSGDTVYVASGQRVYALNKADGNQKWRYPSGEPLAANFRGTPVLVNGTIICIAQNNTVYAMDAATGAEKWSYLSPVPLNGDPVVSKSTVVFQRSDNAIMAVNADTGQPLYDPPIRINDGITGRINVWNDDVLVFVGGRILYSINIATQKTEWKQEFDFIDADAFPVATKDTIYVNSNSFVTGLTAGTGRPRFSTNVNDPVILSPAVTPAGMLVATRGGKVYFLDAAGKLTNRKGLDLTSDAIVRPTALSNGMFAVATLNGNINLVSPSGNIAWNYPVRPIGGIVDAPETSTSGAPGGKGGGFGGPGGGAPGAPGGAGAPGGQGGGIGRGNTANVTKIVTIQAAAPLVVDGDTLFELARDGSLLSFDKDNGVDLTPPTVVMTYPNPGDQVSPRPPLVFVFKMADEASGVKESTIKITVDGVEMKYDFNREGVATVRFAEDVAASTDPLAPKYNKILSNGRKKIVVEVSDWLGNVSHTEYVITIDNTLAPVTFTAPTNNRGGLGGPGGGGKGGGGGAGSGE